MSAQHITFHETQLPPRSNSVSLNQEQTAVANETSTQHNSVSNDLTPPPPPLTTGQHAASDDALQTQHVFAKGLAPMSLASGPPATIRSKSMTALPVNRKPRGTYAERHPEEALATQDRFWTRGRKKMACGLCVIVVALLVTLAVIIAFLVRTPSVSYDSAQPICPNNDWVSCAQNQVQIMVMLNVDNPNIIGGTINADVGLYKADGTFLGPGVLEDTKIKARGTTQVAALCTITSNRAYDILQALFVPPTRDVPVTVNGKVYFHVGSLRPSYDIGETVTIPAQSLSVAAEAILGALGARVPTSVGDAVDQINDRIPGGAVSLVPGSVVDGVNTVGGVASSTTNTVGSAVDTANGVAGTVSDTANAAGGVASTVGGVASTVGDAYGSLPSSIGGISLPGRSAANGLPVMDPIAMGRAVILVGPPGSSKRKAFETTQQAAQPRNTRDITPMLQQPDPSPSQPTQLSSKLHALARKVAASNSKTG